MTIKQCFKTVQAAIGLKGKDLYMPIRIKLTGMTHGIEMYNVIKILGKEETAKRLQR
jgi:nondiscriminating glutamyl-tRNA synthetase